MEDGQPTRLGILAGLTHSPTSSLVRHSHTHSFHHSVWSSSALKRARERERASDDRRRQAVTLGVLSQADIDHNNKSQCSDLLGVLDMYASCESTGQRQHNTHVTLSLAQDPITTHFRFTLH